MVGQGLKRLLAQPQRPPLLRQYRGNATVQGRAASRPQVRLDHLADHVVHEAVVLPRFLQETHAIGLIQRREQLLIRTASRGREQRA